jgi:anti-sigma regulatory factor (Ser/Thr protein kinase)
VGPLIPALPVVTDLGWTRVAEPGAAGAVRRAAAALGHQLGLTESRVGELAILAAELAGNLHKHAEDGQVLIRSLRLPDTAGVELVALDSGPGMADAVRSGRDGHSTTGTLGIGMGAIERLATSSEVYSVPGRGTVVTAQVWPERTAVPMPAHGLTRPLSGEPVSGDGWAVRGGDRLRLMMCDGLGHGPLAASASQAAVDAFHRESTGGPAAMIEHLHRSMSHTRGGAVAIAEIDPAAGQIRFAGLGNIAGHIVSDPATAGASGAVVRAGPTRSGSAVAGRYRSNTWASTGPERRGMVSMPGIAGHQRRSLREFSYPVSPGDLVILHSDGVTDKWQLSDYPGLSTRSPLVIAATLLRDAGVRRDDGTVLVARVTS